MLNEIAGPASRHCDVLVIGGGPAGSTAAALLAEKGHQVTLLEKAHHPRFHIGESLLPANLSLFDQLGVRDEIEAIGMEKWGVEFVSPWHEHRQTFEFGDAWNKTMPLSFQVRRSEFDEILIRNAGRKGAEVIEGCRALHRSQSFRSSLPWKKSSSKTLTFSRKHSAACKRPQIPATEIDAIHVKYFQRRPATGRFDIKRTEEQTCVR